MSLDYRKIREDKKQEYGTKVVNYGRLIASLYGDRTHFIFELLQNAEDALRALAPDRQGSKAVSFDLTKHNLRVGHFGRPFDEADVRGICDIGESVKADDLTAIGRFGIGFKSVYNITDRPEIHSGLEHFAIEHYVLPEAIPTIDTNMDETVFLLPLKPTEESAYDDVATGLSRLGASSLLFLRQIDEVQWCIDDGRSGHYLRESTRVDQDIRHVTVIGQMFGNSDVSTDWLVFSRGLTRDDVSPTGHVEIAFLLDPDQQNIQPISGSPLVVFFPTTLETHLGFLMQGPYQTTPSRDNVPPHVPWNKHLVEETSILLIEALRWLRDRGELTTEVLRCLPLNLQRFRGSADQFTDLVGRPGDRFLDSTSMFAPLFNVTKHALASEALLPGWNSGYVSAKRALLGRTEGIRQLFSSAQLSALYVNDQAMAWLRSDITQDRTPELRDYLMGELRVDEIDPEAITRKLNSEFLEQQTDTWIVGLYEFLSGQPAIIRMLTGQFARSYSADVPLIRLTDGAHVSLGKPLAFLPSEVMTDFPTVRPSVCVTPDALNFLRSIGLREPDLVDDMIQNVLPKYQDARYTVDDAEYETDIARIIRAFTIDSSTQRQTLLEELRRSTFVKSVAPGTSKTYRSRPNQVYLATAKMKRLFEGVEDVRIVDDGYSCLRGQQLQELLEACGATSHLKPASIESSFTYEERLQMRDGNSSTRPETVTDWTLMGLDGFLARFQSLTPELREDRASMLWTSLIDLVERDGTQRFWGAYAWHYYSWHNKKFPAKFITQLNESAWIPDEDGGLRQPSCVVFETLGWQEHPFLLSQIQFLPPKPPIVDTLAREVGIEAESLRLMVEHRVTGEQLRQWLGVTDGATQNTPVIEDSGPREPFGKVFFDMSAEPPAVDIERPVILATEGPLTEESAMQHTQESGKFGRTGEHRRKTERRWVATEVSKNLADTFKTMVQGDYGGRCQICGTTFRMRNGELQTFVVHVVEPKGDARTNNLGDLMGLCGRHFSLVRYGEWTWLNPETGSMFENSDGGDAWEHWRNFVLNAAGTAAEEIDDEGNTYIGVPIRFWNIYEQWKTEPGPIDAIVRYNKPHWRYLCELLKT